MKKSLDLLTQIKLGDDTERELVYALLNQLVLDVQETDTVEVGIEELTVHLKYSDLDIPNAISKLALLSDNTPEVDDKKSFHILKVMLEGVLSRRAAEE